MKRKSDELEVGTKSASETASRGFRPPSCRLTINRTSSSTCNVDGK
jgi:hypothetical protein